jgi:hypothetical protein
MTTNAPDAHEAQAPPQTFRHRRWRIPLRPAVAPPIKESEHRDRQPRRKPHLWREVEAARIAEKQFKIRVERAVMVIARTICDTRAACRAVGLHGAGAECAVKALCDSRGIPRRYFWGVPHPTGKAQSPYPATVKSRKPGPI